MKIKLALREGWDQTIWANAKRTAQRVEQWPAWKRGGLVTDTTSITASAAESATTDDSTPAVDKE